MLLRCSPTNPTVSIGFKPEGAVNPNALGTWPERIMVPTPVVKPAMTETGTSLAQTPRRVTPDTNCNPPHARVIKGSDSNPCSVTAPTTNKLMAAAGPVIARVVPPMRPPASPETAAVVNPTSGGTPLATAMANDRGTAMQPTVIPADTSVKSVEVLNILRQSTIKEGRPRSNNQGLSLVTFTSCFSMVVLTEPSFESSFSSLSSGGTGATDDNNLLDTVG
mmetsp:Transcript_3026/g.5576  ORF Transcript_3026/g.5576 Transcript_3026/m.5576 type:complete len:221 (-) Transcript_3026:252-914(-)